ncbi:MAG: helix-turn-helix domain-containing protein [Bacteroidia bacterium]|nr:helix-turn-helix domain-containing protein [Bacteroidia bacterium]
MILSLVDEAIAAGACQAKACEVIGLTTRTYQRWKQPDSVGQDRRPIAVRPEPKHKLTQEEKKQILETVNQPQYASKPPSRIVPELADQGTYIASESSFYRVLREAGCLT